MAVMFNVGDVLKPAKNKNGVPFWSFHHAIVKKVVIDSYGNPRYDLDRYYLEQTEDGNILFTLHANENLWSGHYMKLQKERKPEDWM